MSEGAIDDFISVLTHQFRKVGAINVIPSSDYYYEKPTTRTGDIIRQHGALLAQADAYGLLVFVPPGTAAQKARNTHGLYYGSGDSILKAIEADRAQAEAFLAETGKEAGGKQADLPLESTSLKYLEIESGAIWHISFHTNGDFLLVCTPETISIFSTASLIAGDKRPFVCLEMDLPMVDVVWNRRSNRLELGILLENHTFRVYDLIVSKQQLQCTQVYDQNPVTAIASTSYGWAMGHPDGSIVILNEAQFDRSPVHIAPHQLPEDITTSGDAVEGQLFGIHSLTFLEPGSLLVGMLQFQQGQELTADVDPVKVNIAAYNMVTKSWLDYGDVVRDEDRCREDADEKLFEGRMRYLTASIPRMRITVFASTKATEVTIIGADPDLPSNQSWPIHCWTVGESETDQIVVPIDEDYKETYALGLVVNTTNTFPAKIAAAGEQKDDGPTGVPAVFMLTTNGRLHAYQLLTSHPQQLLNVKSVMQPVQTHYRTIGESVATFNYVTAIEEAQGEGGGGGQEGRPDEHKQPQDQSEDEVRSDGAEARSDSETDEEVSFNQSQPDIHSNDEPGSPQLSGHRTSAPYAADQSGDEGGGSGGGGGVRSPPSVAATPPKTIPFSLATKKVDTAAPPPTMPTFTFDMKAPANAAPTPAFPTFNMDKPTATTTTTPAFNFTAPTATTTTGPAAPFSFSAPVNAAVGFSGGFSFTTPTPAAAAPVATKPVTAPTSPPPALEKKPSPAPPPVAAKVEEPAFVPPVLPKASAKKNLQFDLSSPPPTTTAPPSTAPFQPPQQQTQQPAPATAEIKPKESAATRSILKPSAAPSPSPAPVAAPQPNKFAIDYKSAESTQSEQPVALHEIRPLSVDPATLKPPEGVGNPTEQQFLKALLTVGLSFKQISASAQDSRNSIMALQQTNIKFREDEFNLRRLRVLSSRTRVLCTIATQLEAQTNQSQTQLDDLIIASKQADKTAAECKSMLANHEDEEYATLMENLSLDVHSARLQTSIDKSVSQLKQQIAGLEAHLQELYTQYNSYAPISGGRFGNDRRSQAVVIPTVKSVVEVLNSHGQTVVDLEERIDDLQEQIESLRLNPPPSSGTSSRLEKERRQRQQLLREERSQHHRSPIDRLSSITSVVPMTPTSRRDQDQLEESKEQEDSFPNRSQSQFSPFSPPTRSPSMPQRTPSTFRASSLSALSSSFNEKLKSHSGSRSNPLRPGYSREASILAIHRGKSKQRLDQLFTQVDQQQFGGSEYGENKDEETASEQGKQDGANTRRWARTGPVAHTLQPPPAEETGHTSEDEDEHKDMVSVNPPPPISALKSEKSSNDLAGIKNSNATPFTSTFGTTAAVTTTTTAAAAPIAAKPAASTAVPTFNFGAPPATLPVVEKKEKDATVNSAAIPPFAIPTTGTTATKPTVGATGAATTTTTAPVVKSTTPATTTPAPFAFGFGTSATGTTTTSVATNPFNFSASATTTTSTPATEPPKVPKPKSQPAAFSFPDVGVVGKPQATTSTLITTVETPTSGPPVKITLTPPTPAAATTPAVTTTTTTTPSSAATAASDKPPALVNAPVLVKKVITPTPVVEAAAAPVVKPVTPTPAPVTTATTVLPPAPAPISPIIAPTPLVAKPPTVPPVTITPSAVLSAAAAAVGGDSGDADEVKTAPSSPVATPSPKAVTPTNADATAAAADVLGGLSTAAAAPPKPATNLFGGSTGSLSTGLFGPTPPSSSVNLFASVPGAKLTSPLATTAASTTAAATTTPAPALGGGGTGGLNLFGSALSFGSPTAAATTSATSGANLFSAPATNLFATKPASTTPIATPFNLGSGNLFGTPPANAAATTPGGGTNLFGKPATTGTTTPGTNLFGSSSGQPNLFSSTPSNLFGTGSGSKPATGNLFATPSTNLFGSSTPATAAPMGGNIFGGSGGTASATASFSNLFGSSAVQSTPPTNNPFATASQQGSQPGAPGGPFGQPSATANPTFGQPSTNPTAAVFGRPAFGSGPALGGLGGGLPATGGTPNVAALAFGGGLGGGIGGLGGGFGSSGGGMAAFGSRPATGAGPFGSGSSGGGNVFGGGSAAPQGPSGFGAIAASSGGNVFGGGGQPAQGGFGGFGAVANSGGGGFPQAAAGFPGAQPGGYNFDTGGFRG